MYIKLGNTEIKYNSSENNYIILSEVVDSEMSYETPVIVNTSDELDIWFGKNYKERGYLNELLGSKQVSLYLYKPEISDSLWCNRDTIRILDNSKYLFPSYIDRDFSEKTSTINGEVSLDNLDINRIVSGLDTYVFEVNINFDNIGDGWFLVIPKEKGSSNLPVLLYKTNIPEIPSIYYSDRIKINSEEELYQQLSNAGFEIIDKDGKTIIFSKHLREVNYFYSESSNFNMIPRFDLNNELISKSYKGSYYIEFMSKTVGGVGPKDTLLEGCGINIEIIYISEYKYRIIISRFDYIEYFEGSLRPSLGEERIDNLISKSSKLVYCNIINDSEIPTGKWTLLGSYKENYSSSNYISSIEKIFDNEKSIYPDFLLIPKIKNIVGPLDPDLDYYKELKYISDLSIDVGTQILVQNSENGWKYEFLEKDPDNPEKGVVYVINNSIYKILGEDGVLIETTDREITNTYGNDFIFNYTEDMDNRIMYFYNDMKVEGYDRPGYYLFLLGFLQDIYSMSSYRVLYNQPSESLLKKLQEKKCNYLVYNNLLYYYEKYQNGEEYNTTGWMRFILGKVFREIEKKRWKIVSLRSYGEISEIFEDICTDISNRFSMVREIEISDLNIDYTTRKVSLTIETKISDLPNNNYTVDVTLNYNNK